ncbi:MAG: PLP-dependent aspartate aminotransferase family protein [Chloroflexi bacterium]|nr:PLP-dependent aspartate aminotransferase family protein [Chloroflexota bacterium]
MRRNTELLHYAEDPAAWEGAVNPPIYRTSLFCYANYQQMLEVGSDKERHYTYTRAGNPTTHVLEQKIASLEHTDEGMAFGSGMAAITTTLAALLRAGDHMLLINNAYGPVHGFCRNTLARFGVTTELFQPEEGAALSSRLQPNTRLIYLESPGSMTFDIVDLRAVSHLARERGIVTVIDNTWATPLFQNPVDLGIDLVIHTGSKYLGGHSDLVFGLTAGSAQYMAAVRAQAVELGGIISPEDAYLAIRGLRTLPIRMAQHQKAGLQVARWLEQQPLVSQVMYPGLESFPGHALAASQMSGYSGLFSFRLQPRGKEAQQAFVDTLLPLFHLGCSWGGFESLITPAFGLDSSAYRVSIGLEDVEDIIELLDEALKAYASH